MPLPIAGLIATGGILGGHLSRHVVMSGFRTAGSQFIQSLPFGAGYSLGTFIGFPRNYQSKSSNRGITRINLDMAYYRRYGGYRRYGRYGRRYGRRSYRRYRRWY